MKSPIHIPLFVCMWLVSIAFAAAQPAADETEPYDVVQDRTRSLSDAEEKLVLQLLAASDAIPPAEQQATARKLIQERREKMPEFADRSDSEFLVEDLLRSTDFYRGKLVEFEGYARKAAIVPVSANDAGIDHYYRLFLYVEEGDSSPVAVCFRDLPENWPEATGVIDDVSVVGRFVKLIEYDDRQTGRAAYAPLIAAERVEYRPKIQPGDLNIDPAAWNGTVRHKKTGWSNAERTLYYRVLKHAGDGDDTAQRAQAKKNLRQRIEHYRTFVEAENARLKQRAERYLAEHPDEKAEHQRQLDDADTKLQRKLSMYMIYRRNPQLFPLYADLVINDHTYYDGKLITLSGRVRQITKSPADDKIRYDIGTMYELWFYTDDSQRHPTVAICTSVPEGLLEKARTEGERLDEPISVTGYFFKMYVYEAQDTDRFTPMLLAHRPLWNPEQQKADSFSAAYVLPFIGLLVGVMVYFFWKTKQEDQAFRSQLETSEQALAKPEFDQIEGMEDPLAPSFDHVDVTEEPHFRDHGEGGSANDV